MGGVGDIQIVCGSSGLGVTRKEVAKHYTMQFGPLESRIPAHSGLWLSSSSSFHGLTNTKRQQLVRNNASQIRAVRRRRRADISTGTYVLLEPGEDEVFVSEEELRERLKGWLENWPAKSLPPDLGRFESIDDAVQFLVKSVCELEIDGDVGSIQWYEVRLDESN